MTKIVISFDMPGGTMITYAFDVSEDENQIPIDIGDHMQSGSVEFPGIQLGAMLSGNMPRVRKGGQALRRCAIVGRNLY